MEAKAINRYVGSSPRKMRLVIDLIRGKSIGEAMNILHFLPKHGAKTAEKVLRSAVANFQNRDVNAGISTDELFVKECFVNGAPSMKRILPAPMGRAYKILKRSNHLTIVVDQRKVKK
jgi:large subunit ribosomal protein L22